jgi:ribose transport system substrate-binding protein
MRTHTHPTRWIALAAAAATLAVAGCSSSGSGDTPAPSGSGGDAGAKVKIGLVQINQEALFFNQMNEGAQKAADELGIDLTIYNSNNKPEAQNEAVADFVTQKFDAVVMVAIDVEAVKPALKEAKTAGLYTAAVDAVVDSPDVDVQVGVDNAAAAKEAAQWLIDNKADFSTKVGVVGALNSFIQNIRMDEFTAPVEADGFTVVQTVDGLNVQDKALTAAENLLTANAGDLTVYATGEPALLGTVAAVKSQARQADVKVIGWDLTAEAIEGIDAGFVKAVVQQDPYTEGYEAVKALNTLATGGTVEKTLNIPIAIVTKANVDEYRAVFG